jgi:hypothetical protein
MSIFISYRRNDSADVTGRIYDRLAYSFGKATIFKDVDSIPFGVNFKTYLNDIIEKSTILLVVIGPQWLHVQADQSERRLDDPGDFVRIEIEAALKRKIVIVPLLVGGASMPKASQLPSSLEELAFYNGIQIRPDPDFHKDMNRLIHELGNQIKPSGREGSGGYYGGSDVSTDATFGDILTRPPVETISIAKRKVSRFVQFLLTPLGRLLAGLAIGGMVFYLLDGLLNTFFSDSAVLSEGASFAAFIGGISGLILYPHRRVRSYMVYGTVIATAMMLVLLYFSLQATSSTAPTSDEMRGVVGLGLLGGTLLGAIVSRIQHLRKKI